MVLLAALLALSGCRVDTKVSVTDRGGSGSVTVSVVLDREALDGVGGQTGLARQLSTSDLAAAGWKVTGPVATGAGGASISVSHGFSSSSEADRLFAELAGSGPAGTRPFHLTLASQSGFLHVRNTFTGKIDLRCRLSCFGDPGLQAALGNPNGVETGPLLQQAGARDDQLFGFTLTATMPGSLRSDNAANRSRSVLAWTTPLGQVTSISAASETLNTGNIVLVAIVGGLLVVGVLSALIVRRRRRAKHARRRRLWPFRAKGKAGSK